MFVKQISVFLNNTEGRLDEVLKILAQGGIDILSASLADTTEFGVLRLLAKEPDHAKQILQDAGFAARVDEVIAVVVPDAVGSLAKVVGVIHAAGINISYIKSFAFIFFVPADFFHIKKVDNTFKVLTFANWNLKSKTVHTKLFVNIFH